MYVYCIFFQTVTAFNLPFTLPGLLLTSPVHYRVTSQIKSIPLKYNDWFRNLGGKEVVNLKQQPFIIFQSEFFYPCFNLLCCFDCLASEALEIGDIFVGHMNLFRPHIHFASRLCYLVVDESGFQVSRVSCVRSFTV